MILTDLFSIKDKLINTTESPGVYLMKDAKGQVLYVGKAKNLKRRLSSYFQSQEKHSDKTRLMVAKILDFETIITESENEAFLLESTLIKQYRPPYNVVFRDDKQYPFLRLNLSHPFPSFTVVRKIKQDGARYFGPFSSSKSLRESLRLVNKTFGLRTCRDSMMKGRTRPCIDYQMGLCLAPCCDKVSFEFYRKNISEAVLVFKGKTPALLKKLRKEMKRLSLAMEFEEAARVRDKLFALEKTIEPQFVVANDFIDRDIIGRAELPGRGVFTLMRVRSGLFTDTFHFSFKESLDDEKSQLSAFIRDYYLKQLLFPKEILIPSEPEDMEELKDFLYRCSGRSISLARPLRGEKLKLLEWAESNAEKELKEVLFSLKEERVLLERLGKKLNMKSLPLRIECFDNANIQGQDPVSAMVVFLEGRPSPSHYRRYKLKKSEKQDDYAYMAEVLHRRFSKKEEPLPDLLLLDGGKGQLGIAVEILKEFGLFNDLNLAAIAEMDSEKGETQDKVFIPARMNPLNFLKDTELLFLLMRIRDEAHKTALSFHRRERRKTGLKSRLDEAPGVGLKKKAALLEYFGSFNKLLASSAEDISKVEGFGLKSAKRLYTFLHSTDYIERS